MVLLVSCIHTVWYCMPSALRYCTSEPVTVVLVYLLSDFFLSRSQLVTVEAPGYPRHQSSIQHEAVVKVYVIKFLVLIL